MQILKITVYRPCLRQPSRSAEQLGRSYRDQAGLLKEALEALDHPTITVDVPDAPPALWFPLILQLLPEDVCYFEAVEIPGAPDTPELSALPRIWVVRECETWPESIAPLPADSPARLGGADYVGEPPSFRCPRTFRESDRFLFASADWRTCDVRTPDGQTDPRFPHIHLGPTAVVVETPAA